ncbi:MAG: ATP-binding cassette domain-containing protein [Dysgonamonadaceae bacterium]|jgi:ABC-type lipoprotein export system ATPase subunit|nr:ATP-binding cassette domain-containing protein [Dysgonamonadaceae bacterium]
MNEIRLSNLQPPFISGVDNSASEIWFNKVSFLRGKNCLLSAASGAGKTTLFACLFGERKNFKGNIFFDLSNISTFGDREWNVVRRNFISHVFQDLRLFDELTVIENIGLKNCLTRHKRKEDIRLMLEKAGIADKAGERVEHLSWGQKQRVAIIRALCQPFDFLLLDEPFSHLDRDNIAIMTGIIGEEITARGAGLIICSLGDEHGFEYQQKIRI